MATPNYGYSNYQSLTLTGAITASDTTIPVSDASGLPTEGHICIEPSSSTNKEIIYWTSKSSNNLILPSVGAGRGQGGTTAAAHSSGVTVKQNTVAEMFEVLQDASALTGLATRLDETVFDHVASGGVWTGDSYASTLNASMTAMVCYINGRRISISAVTARAFTASKDVYIDVLDNGDNTGTLVYTEVTNNAASPALAANSIRIGIIVTGASNIASIASINQGQETKLLPIASSTPYAVTDSLGNLICPRDPNRRILGYRIPTGSQATASVSKVDLTSVNFTINIPAGRKVKLTANFISVYNGTSGGGGEINIYDVTSSVQLANSAYVGRGVNDLSSVTPSVVYTPPAAGARTFKCQFNAVTTGTFNTNITSTQPCYLIAELV